MSGPVALMLDGLDLLDAHVELAQGIFEDAEKLGSVGEDDRRVQRRLKLESCGIRRTLLPLVLNLNANRDHSGRTISCSANRSRHGTCEGTSEYTACPAARSVTGELRPRPQGALVLGPASRFLQIRLCVAFAVRIEYVREVLQVLFE